MALLNWQATVVMPLRASVHPVQRVAAPVHVDAVPREDAFVSAQREVSCHRLTAVLLHDEFRLISIRAHRARDHALSAPLPLLLPPNAASTIDPHPTGSNDPVRWRTLIARAVQPSRDPRVEYDRLHLARSIALV